VVDAEAEPARVTVGGGNVVHVEEDGGRRLGVHAAAERLLPRGPGLRGGAPRDAHPPTRRAPPPPRRTRVPRPSRAALALALDGAARRGAYDASRYCVPGWHSATRRERAGLLAGETRGSRLASRALVPSW
jgi:hypothetical protein